MGHKVGIDPADHAGVHISDLKEVVDLGVAGTACAIDHLAHPPKCHPDKYLCTRNKLVNLY